VSKLKVLLLDHLLTSFVSSRCGARLFPASLSASLERPGMMERTPNRGRHQADAMRPATPADYGRISEIICRCLSEVNVLDYGKEHIEKMLPTFAAPKLGEWFAGANPYCLERDGQIVATGTIRGSEIQTVFVDPSRRGQGLGTALMQKLEEIVFQRGVGEITLRSSLSSRDFYERLGYQEHGETHGSVGGRMILMTKRLGDFSAPSDGRG